MARERTYTEIIAAARANEYAWIDSEHSRNLSNELDRAMKINSYWGDMYHEHGREIACLELMYEKACIKADNDRRERQEEEDRRQPKFADDADWGDFINRRWVANSPHSKVPLAVLREFDAKLIADQAATGRPFDDSTLNHIKDMQAKEDEDRAWEAKKQRKAEAEAAEKRRLKDEAEQRQAVKNAEAILAKAKILVKELVVAGALHVGKR